MPRALILAVTGALRELGKTLPVRMVTLYGGVPYGPQLKALSRGVPVVVGTPGACSISSIARTSIGRPSEKGSAMRRR